jgi:hypothetical protein
VISITAAAEALHIERSTLSRYISRHADALNPVRQGRDTLVDLDLLRAHRAENIRLDPAPPPAGPRSFSASRVDEAAHKLRVQRQIGEFDLAERLAKVVPRIEVDDAAIAAVSALRNAFELALDEAAISLSTLTRVEPRILRPTLRAFMNRGLDAFTRQLSERNLPAAPPD